VVTVKSIAEKLGLSSSAVSRVLRNDETIAIGQDTRLKILVTAEQMGYVRKERKKSAPARKKDWKRIVIFHSKHTFRQQIDSAYYFAIRVGIEDACQKYKFDYHFAEMDSLEEHKNWKDTAGALIVGNYPEDIYRNLVAKSVSFPLVSIGIISWFPQAVDHVTHSNYEAVKLALDYLFKNGHIKIGYMGIKEVPGTEQFGSRKQAFISLMREKGLYNSSWVYECERGKDRVEQGVEMMNRWISTKKPLPTAIFCINDPVALGAIKALQGSGIPVPEQVSVIGHDGSFPAQHLLPGLTSVDVHPYQLGVESVKALNERITEGRKIAKKITLYPELIIRESVRKIDS
jgi:LacI family transcriptional regulator